MLKPKHILAGMLLLQTGCAHHAYKPQRVEISRHTLILHETKVQMENAYNKMWAARKDKSEMAKREEYGGFFNPLKRELHCYGSWPEECITHEYKHLAVQYGLEVPDDPHFNKKRSKITIIRRGFRLEGHKDF